jgi:Protein of unknown function (DUF3037)
MVMNRQLCKYSIIRFQPFVETEEFANVGIVLYVPTTRNLHFKLLSAREHERITHFFRPLNKAIYTATLQIMRAELERVQALLTQSLSEKMDFYDELIRPREDIIQYCKNRVLYSTDINQTVSDLFERYVKRDFAHNEQHEEEMRKRIYGLLINCGLQGRFKNDYVGDENKYKVNLPFVDRNRQAAIKPIHFKHPDSNQLINHGVEWIGKITQLKRYGFIEPKNVLFTFSAPDDRCGVLFDAFSDVKSQIEDMGILMADINAEDAIAQFVRSHN